MEDIYTCNHVEQLINQEVDSWKWDIYCNCNCRWRLRLFPFKQDLNGHRCWQAKRSYQLIWWNLHYH